MSIHNLTSVLKMRASMFRVIYIRSSRIIHCVKFRVKLYRKYCPAVHAEIVVCRYTYNRRDSGASFVERGCQRVYTTCAYSSLGRAAAAWRSSTTRFLLTCSSLSCNHQSHGSIHGGRGRKISQRYPELRHLAPAERRSTYRVGGSAHQPTPAKLERHLCCAWLATSWPAAGADTLLKWPRAERRVHHSI